MAEPSPLVQTPMFIHQKKALAWMLASESRGTVQTELVRRTSPRVEHALGKCRRPVTV